METKQKGDMLWHVILGEKIKRNKKGKIKLVTKKEEICQHRSQGTTLSLHS